MDWLVLGGGCADLALEAREPVRVRVVVSRIGRDPPSTDDRVESKPVLSVKEAMLGLRFRASWSLPSKPPGPTDFLGGGLTILELETGG